MADVFGDDFENKITLALCGTKCNHEWNGPPMKIEHGEQSTCSKCGIGALDADLLESEDNDRRKKFALSAVIPLM